MDTTHRYATVYGHFSRCSLHFGQPGNLGRTGDTFTVLSNSTDNVKALKHYTCTLTYNCWPVICQPIGLRGLHQGPIRDFGLGGTLAGSLRDESPTAGSSGRAPAGIWGEAPKSPKNVTSWAWKDTYGEKHELSYRKQIARQMRTQYVDGNPSTLKSRLRVNQKLFISKGTIG